MKDRVDNRPDLYIQGGIEGYSVDDLKHKYEELKTSLHSETPPSINNIIADVRRFMGYEDNRCGITEEDFDLARDILENITSETLLAPMMPELLYELGLSEEMIRERLEWDPELDMLVVGARYSERDFFPEPSLTDVTKEVRARGKRSAAVQFVGRYSDGKPQVHGFKKSFHDIHNLVLVGSTQSPNSLSELQHTMFSSRAVLESSEQVHLLIPTFGGARSDKQKCHNGIEALTTVVEANSICDACDRYLGVRPTIYTYDIHGEGEPEQTFENNGFDFESLEPEGVFADKVVEIISNANFEGKNGLDVPLIIEVFD